MKKSIVRIFTLFLLLSFLIPPAAAHVNAEFAGKASMQESELPDDGFELLPEEILDAYGEEMTVEEFLAEHKGPIPNALLDFVDYNINVIVQFEKPSLIEHMNGGELGRVDQQGYVAELEGDQEAFLSQVTAGRESNNVTQIFSYTKGLNALMLNVPGKMVNELRSMPSVKSVKQARKYTPQLSKSVDWIRGTEVWEAETGYTGEGVTVAIIDTGIDYTHAMLGGSGDVNDYRGIDQEVVDPALFPNAKVIGGWDFVGSFYDAEDPDSIPVPDPNPMDEYVSVAHGTHVAGITGGLPLGTIRGGVAPDSLLYALKVFGRGGSTDVVTAAIEWCIDPNGDGDISDHLDVINMSLGSDWGPADPDDPEYLIVEAASSIGIVVASAAGNAGNYSYILGSPSSADSSISVAASNTGGFSNLPYLTYLVNEVEKFIPYTKATSRYTFTSKVTAQLIDVETFDPSGELCSLDGLELDGDELDGAIALIKRASCTNIVQMNNAKSLGAVAALIYNHSVGTFNIATTAGAEPFSAGSLRIADGEFLKSLAPIEVSVGPDATTKSFSQPGSIASFSSRGPRGYDSKLKPEITAPGSSIASASRGTGNRTVGMSGTSMATPHIAGVAALMKEAHPDWTFLQHKAAMMNTALDLGDANGIQVPRQGAGRVDAYESVFADLLVYADPKLVSLPWALIEMDEDYTDTQTITLQNLSDADVTLKVNAKFTSATQAGATLVPSAPTVTVPAKGTATVDVTLDLVAELMPATFNNALEEYYGYVTFTSTAKSLRIPFYFTPRPYTELVELDSKTTFSFNNDSGFVDLLHTGPLASNLSASPVAIVSPENPDVMPMGDLRLAGVESIGNDIYVSFAMWGPVHNIQPYFNEINLYIYGPTKNYVNFNYNPAWNGRSAENNTWQVVQLDLDTGTLRLGSSYNIVADFNTGYQQWRLPKATQGIVDVFDYEVFSYDAYENEDYGGAASFDMSKSPFAWSLSKATPFDEEVTLEFEVPDWYAYDASSIQGVMLRDFFGKPGIGQVYYWPLEITGVPVAVDQWVNGLQDNSLDIALVVTMDNDDVLAYDILSDPDHGVLVYEGDDLPELTYIPEDGWFGEDSFTFKAANGYVESNVATVHITIEKYNIAPTANDDFFVTDLNTPLVVSVPGILENDSDPNPADTLVTDLREGPKFGTLELEEDGSFVYTPDPGFFGEDSFVYNLIGWPKYREGDSEFLDTATVYITVNPYGRIFMPIGKR